jgi:hypothetical protein
MHCSNKQWQFRGQLNADSSSMDSILGRMYRIVGATFPIWALDLSAKPISHPGIKMKYDFYIPSASKHILYVFRSDEEMSRILFSPLSPLPP